jgi:prepilin-type N-terminal cleavage/methylation domain-containing protein
MQRAGSRGARRAFTLVELLVVIAIIGVLVALLLPAVQAAREASRRMSCGSKLRQLGIAVQNYHDTYKKFPPGNINNGVQAGVYYTSWGISILPYIEQQNLYSRYDFNQQNEHANNMPVNQTLMQDYSCPSDLKTDTLEKPDSGGAGGGGSLMYAPGSYRAVSGMGDGNCWGDNDQIFNGSPNVCLGGRGVMHSTGVQSSGAHAISQESMKSIIDGTSNTIMIGEYHQLSNNRRRTFWAYSYTSYNQSTVTVGSNGGSRMLLPDYTKCVAIGPNGDACKRAWGSFHPRVIQWALADGSVRPIAITVDMNLLGSLASIAGQETAQMPAN